MLPRLFVFFHTTKIGFSFCFSLNRLNTTWRILFVVKNILRKTVFLFRFPCPLYYLKKHIHEKGRCIQLRISYVGKTGCWFGFAHFNSFLTIILRISHAKWAILCTVGFQRKTSYQFFVYVFYISKQPEN